MNSPGGHGTRFTLSRRCFLCATAATAGTALIGPALAANAPGGIDRDAMDTGIRPGADFFRFANGAWYDARILKDDETGAGGRQRLAALRDERIKTLIDAALAKPETDAEADISALYRSFLAGGAGIAALKSEFDTIAGIDSYESLARAFGSSPATGLSSPFVGTTFYDLNEPGRSRYTLTPGGWGLPSREHYLDPAHEETRRAYRDYTTAMLGFAGIGDTAARAEALLALETVLASCAWPLADANDFTKTSNVKPLAELGTLAPGFDWTAFLSAAGVADFDVLIVRQPDAMGKLAAVITAHPLDLWRDWLRARLVSDAAEYLGGPIAEAAFVFYATRLQGQKTPRPPEARAASFVQDAMGMELGRLYVARYASPRTKDKIATMFAAIRATMRQRIVDTAWMGDTTRTEALKKIDELTVKIGWPDAWPELRRYRFDPTDLYGNIRLYRAARWTRRLDEARVPLDRSRWFTTPQAISAGANPALNEITVPAGTLEPPFFSLDADDAANFGAIGGVLAHELSHMFDQVGRRLDATGRMRDWWAPEDATRYEAIATKVETQFSAIEVLPGKFIDGKRTLNENIADISGLGIAFAAWEATGSAAAIDGLTGPQRFFLGWAQMRAAKLRDEAMVSQLATGVHSPDQYRVNGVVPNIDAWYGAFAVEPSDALFLAPDARAKFW